MKTKSLDCQYTDETIVLNEVAHKYGDNIHILSNPVMQSLLSQFSSPNMPRIMLNRYLEIFYRELFFSSANLIFNKERSVIPTRMKEHTPNGVWTGNTIAYDSKVVMVDLARAGTIPAFIGHDLFNCFVNPENIRQDHFYINRSVNDVGQVEGVDVSGSKIGGGCEKSYVFFPDPMGATGSSLSFVADYYKNNVEGVAKKYIALHLMVTPEYIRRIQKDHPDMEVFALRLDRGASDDEVLSSMPGTFPEREFGLNEMDYIVPGAGGVGEILNNAYV